MTKLDDPWKEGEPPDRPWRLPARDDFREWPYFAFVLFVFAVIIGRALLFP